MVARAVWNVHALGPALVIAILLGGCAEDLGSVARLEGVAAPSLVRLDDRFAVAARRTGGDVEVLAFSADPRGGWSAAVIAGSRGGEMTVHLLALDGETRQEWNSFLFGTAPDGASRVAVDGLTGSGGQVADGAWVLAFRARDVAPRHVAWSVLDAVGGVIASGTGITR